MTTPVPPADAAPPVDAAPSPVITPTVPSPAAMPQHAPSAAPQQTDEPAEPVEHPELARARKEAAKYRVERNELKTQFETFQEQAKAQAAEAASLKDTLAKLAAVLNPDTAEPPDPAKLAEQLAAEQAARLAEKTALEQQHAAQVRDLTVRATLPNVLTRLGAHSELTTAVLTADGTLAKLDPSADTYTADLEAAVAAALDTHPALKIQAPAAPISKSGPEIPGRSGGSDQVTREQLAHMTPEQINEARKAGRLRSLGVAPG